MMTGWLRRLLSMVAVLTVLVGPAPSWADTSPNAAAVAAGAPAPTTSGDVGATVAQGEIAQGSQRAFQTFGGLIGTLIQAAVSVSQQLSTESDKIAGGLAVITVVLSGVRFAAIKDPVAAWGGIFEDLAILGIFASLYMGYSSFATGFYNWFYGLSTTIAGGDMTSLVGSLFTAGGQLFDAFFQSFKGAAWYEYPAHLVAVFPLLIACIVLLIAGVVFAYYIYVGLIQMAIGAVLGQIAIALGFSEFTRGFFKSWLDFMISAGMYAVVAACMRRLVTQSMATAVADATKLGLSTPFAAANAMTLAIFMLLLAFEIPKIAGMFGGGASASGAALGKAASAAMKVAKMGF
ncbi:type IV secretion system protein [Burkholderia sp. MR1-5-21]